MKPNHDACRTLQPLNIKMPIREDFPSALEPLLTDLPNGSLHLLTDTIGTSSSWMTLRYISSKLAKSSGAVTLVSWTHPVEYWVQETRRACVRRRNSFLLNKN